MIKFVKTELRLEKLDNIDVDYHHGVCSRIATFEIKLNGNIIWSISYECPNGDDEYYEKYKNISKRVLNYIIDNYINVDKEILDVIELSNRLKDVDFMNSEDKGKDCEWVE